MYKPFQIISVVKRKKKFLWFTVTKQIAKISTIELPLNHGYETCIFYNSLDLDNEVVATYNNMLDAIQGHMKIASHFGAKSCKIVLTDEKSVL